MHTHDNTGAFQLVAYFHLRNILTYLQNSI